MADIFRDSTLGQIINVASRGRFLPYADQRPDYVVPQRYLLPSSSPSLKNSAVLPSAASTESSLSAGTTTPQSRSGVATPGDAATLVNEGGVCLKSSSSDREKDLEKADLHGSHPMPIDGADADTPEKEKEIQANPFLVDWDGENDPDRPLNWSSRKRIFISSLISLLTFSVYTGSAIYTSAIPSLMQTFNSDLVVSTLGLTLFVFGYGIGPMFLAPLQETIYIGRTPVYIIGLFLFVLFQVPPIFAKNIETILIFRFLAGFVGSPALATGGASMGDIFPPSAMPYAIGVWSLGAVCGPILGPVIGGFAAQANGWRWPFYELLWISSFAFIILLFLLPETLESTILVRRASRLRKLTGNPNLKSRAELLEKDGETITGLVKDNFVKAILLSVEPAIFFANLYIAFVYAIFYLWFEAFPLVFTDIYHFNLGVSSLPFLGFVVSGVITFIGYALYTKYHMIPRAIRNPDLAPEARLELAFFAAFFIPISLFIFGWSAKSHWIGPVIGAALYLPGIFLIFQCILMYITMGYPKHAASILAGNDLYRSSVAAFFPLFGRSFFEKLGLGGGSSLLAGISLLMIPVLGLLIKYGDRLRKRSKWTDA